MLSQPPSFHYCHPAHSIGVSVCLPLSLTLKPVEQEEGLIPPCVPSSVSALSGTVCETEPDNQAGLRDCHLFQLVPSSLAGIRCAQLALSQPANSPESGGTLFRALEKSLSSCLPGSAVALTALQEGLPGRRASPPSPAWTSGIRCWAGGPLSAQRQDLSQFGEVQGPGALDHH